MSSNLSGRLQITDHLSQERDGVVFFYIHFTRHSLRSSSSSSSSNLPLRKFITGLDVQYNVMSSELERVCRRTESRSELQTPPTLRHHNHRQETDQQKRKKKEKTNQKNSHVIKTGLNQPYKCLNHTEGRV